MVYIYNMEILKLNSARRKSFIHLNQLEIPFPKFLGKANESKLFCLSFNWSQHGHAITYNSLMSTHYIINRSFVLFFSLKVDIEL